MKHDRAPHKQPITKLLPVLGGASILGIILVLLVLLIVTRGDPTGSCSGSSASAVTSLPTPSPHPFMAERETIEADIANDRATAEAQALSPQLFQDSKPEPVHTPHPPILLGRRRPAGDGTIVEGINPNGLLELGITRNFWRITQGDEQITVYAGNAAKDPVQGLLVIQSRSMTDASWTRPQLFLSTPLREGAVKVVDADGMDMLMETDSGTRFRFDVTTSQFHEVGTSAGPEGSAAVTATPPGAPLPTPTPTSTPDAPYPMP